MICCVGLFIGFYIGLLLGGIWIFIAPAIGFIVGIPFDMIFMRRMHHHSFKKDEISTVGN